MKKKIKENTKLEWVLHYEPTPTDLLKEIKAVRRLVSKLVTDQKRIKKELEIKW